KFVWGMNLDDDGPTSAVCADDIVVFNTESCTIFALDARTGKNLWSHFLGDPLTSTPTIANGMVFTSYPANGGGGGGMGPGGLNNYRGRGQKPQRSGDQKKKSTDQGKGKGQPPQPQGQAKQRPGASHVMICLELKTGKIFWQKWIDSDVMSAPVAVDDE